MFQMLGLLSINLTYLADVAFLAGWWLSAL